MMNEAKIVYQPKLVNGVVTVETEYFPSMRIAKKVLLERGFFYCHSKTLAGFSYDGFQTRVFENATTGETVDVATVEQWKMISRWIDENFELDYYYTQEA